MKIRILFRQIKQIPPERELRQKELEHKSDLACVRLGLPLPVRMRPFTGNMNSGIRIAESEYDSIAEFTRLYTVWTNDTECKEIEEEWKKVSDWQRQEILYVDDVNDPIIPWIQMAAEKEKTFRYTVNPNYKMAWEQKSEGGSKL